MEETPLHSKAPCERGARKEDSMKRTLDVAVILAVIAGLCAIAGCTTYRPQYFWEVSKVRTELEANNYQVEKLGVQATSSCPYLFGVSSAIGSFGIPLGDAALLKKAMRDFHQQARMVDRPAFLHNINVEWTGSGIPMLLMVQRVTITADVYEFTGEYVDYRAR